MRCLRHRTHGLQNDNSMLRMQCGLGSYSCCDNLLGILLRHPSRAAATRGRNVGTSARIHAPSCDLHDGPLTNLRPRTTYVTPKSNVDCFAQAKTQWTHNAPLRDNAREL